MPSAPDVVALTLDSWEIQLKYILIFDVNCRRCHHLEIFLEYFYFPFGPGLFYPFGVTAKVKKMAV